MVLKTKALHMRIRPFFNGRIAAVSWGMGPCCRVQGLIWNEVLGARESFFKRVVIVFRRNRYHREFSLYTAATDITTERQDDKVYNLL